MAESRPAPSLRAAVSQRAGGCCEYCRSQERYSPDSFSVEHVTPRAQGGTDDSRNLAFSCQGCNNFKYTATRALDPATGDMVPLFDPRGQRWEEHFAWEADFALVVGLTPTGRATVEKLRLNRGGVVNLRRVLYALGEHPPGQNLRPDEGGSDEGGSDAGDS